jgi:hypothetical protein
VHQYWLAGTKPFVADLADKALLMQHSTVHFPFYLDMGLPRNSRATISLPTWPAKSRKPDLQCWLFVANHF